MAEFKSRKDCFFGVHFDFHAMPGEVVARNVDYDSITQMLDEVKPEYVQIDTKGHPGLSSYPTTVGNRASEIKTDMLKFWREETKKRNVLLFAHHSGLFDMEVIKKFPEWAVVSENGEVSKSFISVFSPYAEEFLIPQLEELAGKYELDGAWIDGDCWGAYVDYGKYAQKAWFDTTGKNLPKANDADYEEYFEFCRKAFENYVGKYITAIKSKYPAFEITSNWIYSHMMPQKPEVKVDFLSGDYSCYDSVNNARFTGRCIASVDMPYDLMSWGQNAKRCLWDETDRTVKEYEQYCQEASVIIALGGGFEFFNIIYGGGGVVQKWAIPRWKKVAEFCKERQDACYKAKLVPEIGVLYNGTYCNDSMLFGRGKYCKGVEGWVNALQNCQFSSSVLFEYQTERFNEYKAIVVPSAKKWNQSTIKALKIFAQNGGKLIVEGESTACFEEVGISINECEEKLIFVDSGESLASLKTEYFDINCKNATCVSECYQWNYYNPDEKMCAGYLSNCGKGKIYTLAFNLGECYSDNVSTALNIYIKNMLENLNYKSVVEVEGSTYVDLTIAEKRGNLVISLINMSGSHDNIKIRSFSEVPPVGSLKVKVRLDKKPEKIIRYPEKTELNFEWNGHVAEFEIEKLHIHSAIEIK